MPVRHLFSHRLNRGDAAPVIAPVAAGDRIPKRLHQVFFPRGALPPALHANIEAIRRRNPGWDHRLYDDDDIARWIREAYGPELLGRVERIDPRYGAARADLFRYLLLYREGGFYLDIKSGANRPFDEVLRPDDRYLISQWPNGPDARLPGAGWHPETAHVRDGEFQQWFIAAAPGHPFLKAVIENVLRNLEIYNPVLNGVGRNGVLRVTGPIAYTLAIEPMLDRHPHRRVDAERDLGLDYSILPVSTADDHAHLRLFKTHYSQLKVPLVAPHGPAAALTRGLLALEEPVRRVRDLCRGGPR